jgi:hypothetical protein
MKDPQRLLDSGSAFERDLLSSSHDEMPSKDLDRRVIAAMAGVPLAGAATAPSLARWLSTKSVIAGIAVVALGALVVGGMLRHEAPSSSQSQAQAPAPAIVPPPTTTTTTTTTPEAVITPDALPNAAAPPRTVAKAAAGPSAPSPAPTASASIAREIELLDDVRAKLGAGTPSEASRALDAYDREFPQGTLRPEATVLRIRTLLLTGERARAEKLGSELIAKNPNGVHAKRVRALLEEK